MWKTSSSFICKQEINVLLISCSPSCPVFSSNFFSYFQHRKHEQDQHDKDISDLVHGIAAGNLWKRRNGQIDDLDLFDEEDMDGRFRRKKKLKVSEKFEMLGKFPFGHVKYSDIFF